MDPTIKKIASNIGEAVLLMGGTALLVSLLYVSVNDQKARLEEAVEQARAEAMPVLHEGRYNDNDTIDKFYVINGRKVPVEVDGKPVGEYFGVEE